MPVVLVAPERFAEEVERSCSFMLGDLAVIDCIPRQASPLYTGRAEQIRVLFAYLRALKVRLQGRA